MVANLAAQESYVIDSVCVGADRTYRVDGEKGSTYEWFILDTAGVTVANPTYTDFREDDNPNPGDTIWGSDITYIWNTVGDFDIMTLHYSVHGCDTLVQGRVKVYEPPFADAGEGGILCFAQDITITEDDAANYSSLYWTTRGDGTFSDPYSLHPVYSPGSADNAEVTLILTAFGLASNGTCIPALDSVSYYFRKPEIQFDVQELFCYNDQTAWIQATVVGGTPTYNYAWQGPPGFVSVNGNYIGSLGAGTYILTVTDANGCVDIDSVEIVNPPELLISVDNVKPISCYGYSDGAIFTSATGGTGTYSFQWRSALGTSYFGDNINGLRADTYYLTVVDENDCVARDTIVLDEPDLLIANISAVDSVLCEGEQLIVQGIPTGGTGALTQLWTGSASAYLNVTSGNNVIFNNAPAGTYNLIYTIVDEANCEASDSIQINVYPPSFSYDSMEVCAETAPFSWINQTVTSDMDRIYRDTLYGMNQYGCDSMLTLEVKVLFPVYYDTTLYVCENEEPFSVFNQTILPGRDSIYLDTLHYVESGCDSLLITINVFTLPVSDTTMLANLCSGAEEFLWNNRWIQTDSSQIYLDTLSGANQYGCDSLLTYDVTIIPPDTFYVDSTLCQDEPVFVWNSIDVQTAFDSIYEARLSNQFGCDSLVYLNMQIIPSTDTIIDTMLCYQITPYAWNNLIIFAENDSTYLDTLVNAAGCDSLLTLNVTILYPDTVYMDTTLCKDLAPFAWGTNKQLIFAQHDSIYTETLQNVFGCDSIVNLDVRILLPRDSIEVLDICENEAPFTWNGSQTILPDRDSIYYDTLYYAAGCDSLRLQLEIISHPVPETVVDTFICEGGPGFDWNGRSITTFLDSTYMDTLLTSWNCDSIVILNVHLVPAHKDTIPEVICFGEPIADWHGQVISSVQDSIYLHTILDPSGCDTLQFYEVTVLPVTDSLLEFTLCAGADSILINNRWIQGDSSRVYFDTVPNRFGCDSLMTYMVTITPPDTTFVYDSICFNDPVYVWNEIEIQTWTDSIYQTTLENSEHCDSVVILSAMIFEGITTDTFVTACEEYNWLEGTGITYAESGTYDKLIGSSSCADTMRLHLIISPPIVLAENHIDVLCYGDSTGFIDLSVTGGIAPFTYLWNTGDTTRNLNNLPAGMYSLDVTDSLGCYATLSVEITQPDSILIALVQITDVENIGELTGSIDVLVSGGTPGYVFEWTDQTGNVAGTGEDLFDAPGGTYTLTVTDANNCIALQTYNIKEPFLSPCMEDTILTCFEDFLNYPLISSFEDYLALLKPGYGISLHAGCDIDTSSFTAHSLIVNGSLFCYEEVRNYTLLDDCGDTLLSCEQHVIVEDKIPPVISCPPTITVYNDVAPFAYADTADFIAAGGSIGDNCGVVGFRQLGSDISDGGTAPEIVTRTYEVVDYCGNVSICEQKFEVFKSYDFAIDCEGLPSESFECKAELPKYNLNTFRADGGYAFSYPYAITNFTYTDVSNGKTCPERITRTFMITNEKDSTVFCTKVYFINDKTPPTLILPDKTIYCGESWPVYGSYVDVLKYRVSHGNDAFDNCGNASIRFVTLLNIKPAKGTCPVVYERVYQITDWCNNSSKTSEFINVYDTIAPTILSIPGDLTTSECIPPKPYTNYKAFEDMGGSVKEDCGILTTTFLGDSVGTGGVVYRTYRFSDGCNYTDYVQKITMTVLTIPQFDLSNPICQNSTAQELVNTSKDGITGTWNPANIKTDVVGITTYTFTPDDGQCAAPFTLDIEVTPEIIVDTLQVVHVGTSDEPIGSIEIDVTGGTPFYKYMWYKDTEYIGGTKDISGLFAGIYTLTVKDANGCVATISVPVKADSTFIAMDCVPTDTLICSSELEVNHPYETLLEYVGDGGWVRSICPLDSSSFRLISTDTVSGSFCLNILRKYTIENSCGYKDTCLQLVVVDDQVPPEIICPHDSVAVCFSDLPFDIETIEEFIAAGGEISDNCGIDSASFNFDKIVIQLRSRTEITTTYTISDLCGNMNSCVQTITLEDTVPPIASCTDINVYLDETGYYILSDIDRDLISAGASDNCTAPEDLGIDVELLEFDCKDVDRAVGVKVVVTDEAGNSDTCVANILVLDTIPPQAICQDITIYLDDTGRRGIITADVDNGSSDNCIPLDTMFLSAYDFDCSNVGPNEVKLTVIDVDGNIDTCISMVTVIDTIPPTVNCVEPFELQLDANAQYSLAVNQILANGDDECGMDTVYLSIYELNCDNIGITPVTVYVVDNSGNMDSCTTEITVYGNIAPKVVDDSTITAFNTPVSINVAVNDYDLKTEIDLSTLSVRLDPEHGIVETVRVNGNLNGFMTYTPTDGFVGTDTLTYSICDDAIPCVAMCEEAYVFITVLPENSPPLAVDDYYDALCGPLEGRNLLNNDSNYPDGDQIQVNTKPVKLPINGTVILESDGSFTYIPDEGFTGIDSFRYEICDDGTPSLCDTASVYITKMPDNDCDGISDADDIDDDNDGILDVVEGLIDIDGDGLSDSGDEIDSDLDGIPDYLDIDSDDDGIVDNIEGQGEHDYILPLGEDPNGNGWDAAYDPQDGGYEFVPTDTDEDGSPDYRDIDSENDHVFDFIEGHDLNADGIPDVTRIFVDSDHDGLDDIYDTVNGWNDPYSPFNAIGSNAPLQDFDGDGTRDWRDTNDENDEYLTVNEDTNNDGDYSNDDLDLDGYPEYLDRTLDCELFIPEGFSPNDDGVHDFFQILCIQRYPNAHLMIFNRNGNKLFDKENYGNLDVWGSNADAWWWGTSGNKLAFGRAGGLPAGNYVYVIELGNGKVENGTIMISY